tara:strand:- start:277 stop:642 length:366 start_codon:yes stop_codon:yes gene_type:complete
MNRLHLLILLFVIVLIGNVLKIKTNKTYIETLIRQASRWSVAAQQDESPIIALLHANYGAGYLWALKDIATSEEIENITSIDALKFEREITSTQDLATKKAIKICPKFAPKGYLSKIGGEG